MENFIYYSLAFIIMLGTIWFICFGSLAIVETRKLEEKQDNFLGSVLPKRRFTIFTQVCAIICIFWFIIINSVEIKKIQECNKHYIEVNETLYKIK